MTENPFPGPQPFRATDRAHFHGREDVSRRLEGAILVHRAVIVHGPSGSGKSSLIQASVLPNLRDAEDIRVVHLDGWPSAEDPTHWLSVAMHSELKHGAPQADLSPSEAVLSSLKRAVRGSSRMLVICIDQLEQLLYPGRDPQQIEAFFDCVNDILELPLRTLRVVMSLREDYLGVFRDRLRDHRRVLGQGFRVGPLTVAELTDAVCKTASTGSPPQAWSPDEMRSLMIQARVPGQAATDEAEVQAAYGQIVCRAMFHDRATGENNGAPKAVSTEVILRRYLDTTLTDLGPLRDQAERLLAEHLVSEGGGRTLRTERELESHFAKNDLQTILGALEGAAILRAASHQGSRYFEIGHDWLARKVFENRQIRQREAEQRRRDEEQQRALEKVRNERRWLIYVAVFLLVGVVGVAVSALWILTEKRKAERAEDDANRAALIARRREIDARDASILAGVRELSSRGKLNWAMKLLPEVQLPAIRRGWVPLASDLLAGNALLSTLDGHTASLAKAAYSPNGKLILTASMDGTVRIWDSAGKTAPIVLTGHTEPIMSASWSHDGKYILSASADGTARIFAADGKSDPVVLLGAKGPLTYAEFSPDDKRVVTASQDGFVRIHDVRGEGLPVETQASTKPIFCVRFHPDGARVFVSTHDEKILVWDAKPQTKVVEVGKHDGAVVFIDLSPDGNRLVSASMDGTARIWDIAGKKPRVMTTIQHDGPVHHAVFSPKGMLVATASADRMARVVRVDGTEPPVVLSGHTQAVTHVAFDPTGYFLATASQDATARIFRIQGAVSLVLRGHDAAVHSIAWKNDGAMVVTAAGDGTDRSPDETAKVWSTLAAQRLGLGSRGPRVFHAADGSLAAQRLATVHGDGALRVITPDKVDEPTVLRGGAGVWVAGVSLSADGRFVATASFDKLIRYFQVDKPAESVTLGSHDAEARFAVFSPDATRVLSGGDDGRAIVFAVDGKTAPIRLEGHRDWLTAGAWSADGKRVVTTSFDHTARIWNADGQGAAIELTGHKAEVLAVAFFPDNQRIVTASVDHTARIWTPGQEPRILRHDAAVYNVAVSSDNKFVATYAADRLIRVWRVGFPDPPIELESAGVRLLAFEREGQRIAALDEDGSLHVWTVDVDALREQIVVANADCLPASIRVLYLNEALAIAEERYAACRRNPYEMLWFHAVDKELLKATSNTSTEVAPARIVSTPTLKELGTDMVRVKVVVLPTDADVEMDGVLMTRRQGVVEFVGKAGQTRKLHVQRGAKHRLFEVTIGESGASPARLDLNDKPAGTIRSGTGTSDKPAATEKNPLLPETNE